MTEFSDVVQQPGERVIVYGGTRTGKSSYMDWSIREIQRTRPHCMMLLLDTKPRFRAEKEAYGLDGEWRRSAKKHYESWAAGPLVPNSVRMDLENPYTLKGLWDSKKNPGEIVILQASPRVGVKQMIAIVQNFVSVPLKGRERLVIVDEGMDFYMRNTLSIDPLSDPILRTARAGGEQNVGLLFGSHRPRGIPPLLNTLSSRIVLFHLRYHQDMRYLWDVGIPDTESSPNDNYVFKHWEVLPGGHFSDARQVRLKLPESYLKQLALT